VAYLAQPGGKELALTYNFAMLAPHRRRSEQNSRNRLPAHFLASRMHSRVALAGEAGATHASSQDLTLVTYMAGPQLRLLSPSRESRSRLAPFVQLLLGGAHASGAMASTAGHSSNAFAFRVGGGLDVPLNSALTLRAIQADYLLTLFPSQVNDRQKHPSAKRRADLSLRGIQKPL
jgi:hypothetical protein